MSEAGELRHNITIQSPEDGKNACDGTQYKDLCTVRAAVLPIRGREMWEAEQAQSLIDHRIKIRYRAGIRRAMRVAFEGRIFTIEYIIDPKEDHRWLQLMCREVEA